MLPPILTLTQSQTFEALRYFLLAVLPEEVAVVQSQVNRVPEPGVTEFVMMNMVLRERLETNVNQYSDGFKTGGPTVFNALMPTKVTIQLDVHGERAGDMTEVIMAMFRSDWGVEQFKASGFDVTPLYTSDPNQLPYTNDQQQIEERWVLDVVLQCNPIVQIPQDFAAALKVGLIEVDAKYPPT